MPRVNAVWPRLFKAVGNGSLVLSMNNTTLTVVIMLLLIACGNYNEINVHSTRLVSQGENVLSSTKIGLFIPIELDSGHVPEGQNIEYSSIPPTSGRHWNSWAECGFYTQSLPDERLVHNLEHGNIVISYNLANRSEVTKLRDSLETMVLFEDWGVARPYYKMEEGRVVLAAWGRIHSMVDVIPVEIESFFTAFAGGFGPERIPC